MKIKSIRINNFRSIIDETLECENLTALVGANGSGKSSFLRGLELFYEPNPKIEIDDFYNRETTNEIVIAITFEELSKDAIELFSTYLYNDKLTVERVFSFSNEKMTWNYHGSTLRNPEFQVIRDLINTKGQAKSAKDLYEKIRDNQEYKLLPEWSNIADAQENLKNWELKNPKKCTRSRDDGQFFGFKGVAQGYLGRYTRFLYIPAVRDANDDSSEKRGSVFSELMDIAVRNALANNEELKKFKQETQDNYTKIIDPASQRELFSLADRMTKTLKTYVPDGDVSVQINWLPFSDFSIPLPQADVKLIEDGYSTTITRTGHGLQRAFILTILQHLTLAQNISGDELIDNENKEASIEQRLPDLVLAIEEPELYQHPCRQRHLAKILLNLASGKISGVAENTQIIYATHSPLFVGVDRIDQIRLLRKIPNKNNYSGPKISNIISTNLDNVAKIIWIADGQKGPEYSRDTLLPRLPALMTPWMSEGFFANVSVLVEGEDDRAAILGTARLMGIDLESDGFSVIPCGGKNNLDRPSVIFKQLGIPTYIIWDSDKDGQNTDPKINHRLLRLMGKDIEDWPSMIDDKFACFETNLEKTLENEIGQIEFNNWLQECQNTFGISLKKYAIKNPVIIEAILNSAKENGKRCATLETIVTKIVALKS